MSKVYFITGCNGLVGSHIARQLIAGGHRVRALRRKNSNLAGLTDIAPAIDWIEGDILDVPMLRLALKGVSYVVHAAAKVSLEDDEKKIIFKTNVEGTANLVDASLEASVKKFCLISSIAALGTADQTQHSPLINEKATWDASLNPSAYAQSKQLAEREVARGAAEGLATCIVNPSVVFGLGDWNQSSGLILKHIWEEPLYYPPGDINLVDARDVALAVVTLLHSDISDERFILNGGTLSYRLFFEKVAQHLGKKAARRQAGPYLLSTAYYLSKIGSWFTGKPPRLNKNLIAAVRQKNSYDSTKIRNAIGLQFKTPDETLDWVCSYYRRYAQQAPRSLAGEAG